MYQALYPGENHDLIAASLDKVGDIHYALAQYTEAVIHHADNLKLCLNLHPKGDSLSDQVLQKLYTAYAALKEANSSS